MARVQEDQAEATAAQLQKIYRRAALVRARRRHQEEADTSRPVLDAPAFINRRRYAAREHVEVRLALHDATIKTLLKRVAGRSNPTIAADLRALAEWIDQDRERASRDLCELSEQNLDFFR